MKIVPITLKTAKEFIDEHHRHTKAPVGWKFGAGLADSDGNLIGVAIAGRPVARMLDDGTTIEVSRCCVEGYHRNANSMLYAAVLRAAKALGYERAITYTLASEPGSSVRAAGFHKVAQTVGGEWDTPSRPRQLSADVGYSTEDKLRWEKDL